MTKTQKQIKEQEKKIIKKMKNGQIAKQDLAKEFNKILKLAGL